MWLSRRGGIAGERRGAAGMGQVTIGGTRPAVRTEGEIRRATILSPGGYAWAPRADDDAMVLQAGDLGEEACLVGVKQQPLLALEPGELVIGNENQYIHITQTGIEICGDITLDGSMQIRGTLVVKGDLRASDDIWMNGDVYINGVYQMGD